MTKLKFKQLEIENNILPNLRDGIEPLVKARNQLEQANIPDSYKYKGNLIQIKNELSNINNSLQNENDRISSSITKIVRMEEELEQAILSLRVTEIIKRENKI